MIIDSLDEWGHFLHARKLLIDRLFHEGQTPDPIARTLSMDGDQALLIALTPVDPQFLVLTRSQRMALTSIVGEYLRTENHVEMFYDASNRVETRTEELLTLLLNP